MKFQDHIRRAIEIVGSQASLADKIGISQQGVSWLLNGASQISAEHAIAIESATDGQVTRTDLRPDLFGATRPIESRGAVA